MYIAALMHSTAPDASCTEMLNAPVDWHTRSRATQVPAHTIRYIMQSGTPFAAGTDDR